MPDSPSVSFPSIRTVVFASSHFALPVINTLIQKQMLSGVIVPDPSQLHTNAGEVNGLIMQLQQAGIPHHVVCKEKLPQITAALDQWQSTLGIIATYPHILPNEVTEFFTYGAFNLHGSLLPAYAGPAPLFWQIKNQESKTGVVLHKAEQKPDSGNIVLKDEFSLHPLDTIQSLGNQIALKSSDLVVKLVASIEETGVSPEGESQQPLDKNVANAETIYARRPEQKDVEIKCTELEAEEISALCRASASQSYAAYLMIKNAGINVLQATAVDYPTYGTKPGTVAVVDENEGFIICVKGGCVRLDVLANMDGVFSGAAFAERFNIDAGMQIQASSIAL